MTRLAFFLCFLSLCLFSAPRLHAATLNAASCSQNDVEGAIAAASNGDTIVLPNCGCGTATWSSPISISKSVTLKGQGPANTCIQGSGLRTNSVVNNWRITGIHFQRSGGPAQVIKVTSGADYNGSPLTGWIIDNNIFEGYGEYSVGIYNDSTGVIANNTFLNTTDPTVIWVSGRDNNSWNTASPVGTNKNVFIEDNKFIAGASSSNHVVMGMWGGSYVFRCNEMTYTGSNTYKDFIDVHGYGHGTYRRGGRSSEVYGNHLDNTRYSSRTVDIRGGTGRMFANSWKNGSTYIELTDYRMISTGLSMAYPTNVNNCATASASCPSGSEATCCADHEGHACCDQIGTGIDTAGGATRQASDPYYLWNNTSDSGAAISVRSGNQTFIQQNRDYYVGNIPDGYTPYAYPHPLRELPGRTVCLDDGNSQAKTGITFWAGGGTSASRPSPPRSLTVR